MNKENGESLELGVNFSGKMSYRVKWMMTPFVFQVIIRLHIFA